MKALACQAKDLSLDVVVSSRELLKVLEQGHSTMRRRLALSGRDLVEAFGGGKPSGGLSVAEQVRNDEVRSERQLSLVVSEWGLGDSIPGCQPQVCLTYSEGLWDSPFPSVCLCFLIWIEL